MDHLIQTYFAELLEKYFSRLEEKLNNSSSTSPWLTVKEAADRVKVSESTIRKMIDKGEVKSYQRRNGGAIRLLIEDVDGAFV